MKVQSIQHMMNVVIPTPLAIAIGAISKLIGVEVTGIRIHSGDGSFVATATCMLHIPPVKPWLGGTPMKSVESLNPNERIQQ